MKLKNSGVASKFESANVLVIQPQDKENGLVKRSSRYLRALASNTPCVLSDCMFLYYNRF